jgi:hypothetical protein
VSRRISNSVVQSSCVQRQPTLRSPIFWDITSCSPLKVNRHFGGRYFLLLKGRRIRKTELATFFLLVHCLAYYLILKFEATYFPETSVDFQRATCRYIPEDATLHNHRNENLKSFTGFLNEILQHISQYFQSNSRIFSKNWPRLLTAT